MGMGPQGPTPLRLGLARQAQVSLPSRRGEGGKEKTWQKPPILEAPGEGLKIADVTYAEPSPHEVLIDTKACGLCHSDLHFIDEALPSRPAPAFRGHEAAGIVRAVGSEVRTVKPGDHVVFLPQAPSAGIANSASPAGWRCALAATPAAPRERRRVSLLTDGAPVCADAQPVGPVRTNVDPRTRPACPSTRPCHSTAPPYSAAR